MNLLDNELVRKYFNESHEGHIDGICDDLMAMRVLRAMQEPIKKGERYLTPGYNGETIEEVASNNLEASRLPHLFFRLPDRFQKQECFHQGYKFKCCGCDAMFDGVDWTSKPKPSPEKCCFLQNYPGREHDRDCPAKPKDEVEEKIRLSPLTERMISWGAGALESQLRLLVKLARGEPR